MAIWTQPRLSTPIRIKGHLGAMVLTAFPAMADAARRARSPSSRGYWISHALYGVLAEIEALGLDLLEVRQLQAERPESPEPGEYLSQ